MAIINLFLLPLWMLSGALFLVSGASHWVPWLMRINPLTYGMNALLQTLFPGTQAGTPGMWPSIAVLGAFATIVFVAGFVVANQKRTIPAA